MSYEVWDTQSGNLVGAYRTEREALQVVRELVQLNGRDYGEGLALLREDRSGSVTGVAEGAALVEWCVAPRPAPAS